MKNIKILLIFATFILLTIHSPSASASSWLFSNEAELKTQASQLASNPRATYYVIIHAYKLGMAAQATLDYENLLTQHPKDPLIMSAYAFAQYMAAGDLSQDNLIADPGPLIQKVRNEQMKANYYREQAVKLKPKYPDVLLEDAVTRIYTGGPPYAANEEKTCAEIKKAVVLDPKWAEAHFWYATALNELSIVVSPKDPDLSSQALAQYQRAEDLQPKLHGQCLLGEAGVYSVLRQYDKSLACVDAYIKAYPEDGKKGTIQQMRNDFSKALAEQKDSVGEQSTTQR